MSVVVTSALTKRFGPVTALDSLDVDVRPGVTGLVGANGAGKSTLIKILLGLLPATSGRAEVLGLDVASSGEQIRRAVGYMPEHDCLPPDVTATEFVVHMARMSGLPTSAARERTADTLRHVGLYEERYRPVGGYSTGMKQRVKLAQALVHDPRLVFLDEPTNGLDPAGREDMLGLVRRIGTDFGISVLVTSHLLGELERICDHVVVVDGGRLLRATSTAAATTASQVLTVEVTDRADELVRMLRGAGLTVRSGGNGHGPGNGPTASGDAPPADGNGAADGDPHGLRTPAGTLTARVPDGRFEVEVTDDAAHDVVRDAVTHLGVGLIRMQRRRHHLAEIFQDGAHADPR